MLKFLLAVSFVLVSCTQIIAQDAKDGDVYWKSDYPEGIYKTKKDFQERTPMPLGDLYFCAGNSDRYRPTNVLGHEMKFFTKSDTTKIKNVFALCINQQLYFPIKTIRNNRNKTDRAQVGAEDHIMVRVIMGGTKYLYTEANLVNAWAQGAMYGSGSVAAAVVAGDMYRGKGIVWDYTNQEFNIFKNCEDYNDFMKVRLPSGMQKCKKHQPDMAKVRESIAQLLN